MEYVRSVKKVIGLAQAFSTRGRRIVYAQGCMLSSPQTSRRGDGRPYQMTRSSLAIHSVKSRPRG